VGILYSAQRRSRILAKEGFESVDLVRITPLGTVKDTLLLQVSVLITLELEYFPKIDLGRFLK
jgi:hypothetical protein